MWAYKRARRTLPRLGVRLRGPGFRSHRAHRDCDPTLRVLRNAFGVRIVNRIAPRWDAPGKSGRKIMRYSDLIQLYFERSTALQWYWTLYVVVIGGLLAFSSLRVRQDPHTAALVTVLFCLFAYKNLGSIHDTTA